MRHERKYEEDLQALQRLRLARRNATKRASEWARAERRMHKANRKLFAALDDVESRGLDQLDPRGLDS